MFAGPVTGIGRARRADASTPPHPEHGMRFVVLAALYFGAPILIARRPLRASWRAILWAYALWTALLLWSFAGGDGAWGLATVFGLLSHDPRDLGARARPASRGRPVVDVRGTGWRGTGCARALSVLLSALLLVWLSALLLVWLVVAASVRFYNRATLHPAAARLLDRNGVRAARRRAEAVLVAQRAALGGVPHARHLARERARVPARERLERRSRRIGR
jgi:hypothetical protein